MYFWSGFFDIVDVNQVYHYNTSYEGQSGSGLWTTPTDLAKWTIEISNAWVGRPSKLLSKKMAREMLTIQKVPFGLGVVLKGRGKDFSFGHSGANLGFRA